LLITNEHPDTVISKMINTAACPEYTVHAQRFY
jgi:hypothetical protein